MACLLVLATVSGHVTCDMSVNGGVQLSMACLLVLATVSGHVTSDTSVNGGCSFPWHIC